MSDAYSLPVGRPGRLLAVGLSLVVFGSASAAIVRPLLHGYAAAAASLTARTAQVQQAEALVAQLPAWRERARAVADSLPTEIFLSGSTDAVAAASMQAMLLPMLADLGAVFTSAEEFGIEDAGAHRQLRVGLSFTASWPALVHFIGHLSASMPPLLIDELQIRPARHRVGYKAGTFEVKCTLVAFRASTQRRSDP